MGILLKVPDHNMSRPGCVEALKQESIHPERLILPFAAIGAQLQ